MRDGPGPLPPSLDESGRAGRRPYLTSGSPEERRALAATLRTILADACEHGI